MVLPCYFRELTGLYCPGCGSGHAVAVTLRGNFWEAFQWNPMVYLLGIPSMAILMHEYIRMVFNIRNIKPVVLPGWLMRGIVFFMVVFWILRNISWLSFLTPLS